MLRSQSYRFFLLTLRLSQALTTGHASRYTQSRGHVSLNAGLITQVLFSLFPPR